MKGIVIGTIVNNWDENHQGKVRVEYRLGKAGASQSDWIPVMVSFVGPSYGSYHLPEIGTSVVVGFADDSYRHPFVLGGIRGVGDTLPSEAANENNSKKLWKSKTGYLFFVEEEEKKLFFSDPESKNSLIWSSEEGTLTMDVYEKVLLKIGGEPFLTLEKEKITVAGTVTIQAENMTLKTDKNIELAPSQGMTIKTQQIQMEGTTTEIKSKQLKLESTVMEIKAQANGTLESGGMLAVKGTMLKLN